MAKSIKCLKGFQEEGTATIIGTPLSFAIDTAVANNRAFFERFYRDMLVINGIDTQTNSHDDGRRHTWRD